MSPVSLTVKKRARKSPVRPLIDVKFCRTTWNPDRCFGDTRIQNPNPQNPWSTHNYYHADGNGNITYLVNSSQTLAASYRYDAYGNTLSSSGTLASANVYRFSSKEIHVNSGLYYYLYRFYDPATQRWLNRDPLGEAGFEAMRRRRSNPRGDSSNLYAFIGNNTVNLVDKFGLRFVDDNEPHAPRGPDPELPSSCARRIRDEVTASSDRPFPDPSARYQHCLASCRIARECSGGTKGFGPLTAWIAGNVVQDPFFFPKCLGSDPGDRAANKVGRDASRNENKSCESQCRSAWQNGSLYPEGSQTPEF